MFIVFGTISKNADVCVSMGAAGNIACISCHTVQCINSLCTPKLFNSSDVNFVVWFYCLRHIIDF